MNGIFSFKMTTKATLLVTLLLMMVFASGCRRKQQDKSPKTPPASVSHKQKSPENGASPETHAVEADGQNVVASPDTTKKATVASPDAAKKETLAAPSATKKDTVTSLATAKKETFDVPNSSKKETIVAAPNVQTKVATGTPLEPYKTEQPSAIQAQTQTPAWATEKPETTERPPVTQPEEITSSEIPDLTIFDSLKTPGEKIAFISKIASTHAELLPALVNKALNDENIGVRSAAIGVLAMMGLNNSDIISAAYKAMSDTEPQIRQKALEACASVDDPAISDVLAIAIDDEIEDIRSTAIQLAINKGLDVSLPVFEAGITSPYSNVREASVAQLLQISSLAAVDILITGLNDPDPEFHYIVKAGINSLLSQEFDTYDEAQKWWDANRSKFGDDLKPKQ